MLKLIVSDLHLADGADILDCFGAAQQDAFEKLLQAISDTKSPLGQSNTVEFIINGDCFDFLVVHPFSERRVTDAASATQKVERIIAAHHPFFDSLSGFIELPGRSVTFMVGNHDMELFFVAVRERICAEITGRPEDPRVKFVLARAYRPQPDIYLEHGHHFDFWNHNAEVWNEQGQPLTTNPQTLTLPIGSLFYQQILHAISLRYPYIDHFSPGLSQVRQVALLSLLDPDFVVDLTYRAVKLMGEPRDPLANLQVGEERNPQRLFAETMLDFLALRTDLSSQRPDWPAATETAPVDGQEIREYMLLYEALGRSRAEAIAIICTPEDVLTDDGVTAGLQAALMSDPELRYALAGHTHLARTLKSGQQEYFNTASWVACYARPTADEVTPELLAWFQQPDWNEVPLRDLTQFVFAVISDQGAYLCAWEGDHYRVLASQEE
jgi:UDP-2,3-diacylglucosamine pyrophosphatase LpxH